MKFAVFIDRDGTINQEMGYVDSLDRFSILPRVTDAVRKLNENNIPAIVVTNQSGVGRGYFSLEFVGELHKKMNLEFEKTDCRLDGIYICPHTPYDKCVCRKPKPGLLLKAAQEHGISLHNSYVIGDKIIDIQLAHSVGAKGILVLTGYGSEQIRKISDDSVDKPDYVASNLYNAVEWILEKLAVSSKQLAGNVATQSSAYSSLLTANSKKSRILIIKPSSLGDIVHSLPVLWALRKLHPDAHIGWVVKEVWKDMLIENPLLDEIILLKNGLKGFLLAVNEIRKNRYDTIIDLQGLFRSGMLSYLSGGKKRVGFENAREFAYLFYNKKISLQDSHIHAVDRYLKTVDSTNTSSDNQPHPHPTPPLEGEGINVAPSPSGRGPGEGGVFIPLCERNVYDSSPHFPIYINMEDSEWARDFLIKNELKDVSPLIAINPSARWLKKRWPVSLYAELINRLIQELKAGIIILGSREDIPLAEEIRNHVRIGRPVIAAGNTTLKTLTALLDRIDLLITNDSGPMHIAAALGRQVIALFGATDPKLTGPYGDNHTVIKKEIACSPCFRKPCRHGRPLCMEAITVDDVMSEVNIKLKGK
ncbi:MAG: HAD-IIIA family hydrolase [Nitrospirae bacterium]|nr:HAD-IIIA family hydrolase [Nitrospirota bacterium]